MNREETGKESEMTGSDKEIYRIGKALLKEIMERAGADYGSLRISSDDYAGVEALLSRGSLKYAIFWNPETSTPEELEWLCKGARRAFDHEQLKKAREG